MNTFTFDDVYFFDRQSYDSCWYASTHPATKPFRYGRFDVSSCLFTSHAEGLGKFTREQIAEIEQLLTEHREEMDLGQFDVHLHRPAHYERVYRSEVWERVVNQRRPSWPSDPALTVAYGQLALENPAYRLTRHFVSLVINRSKSIPAELALEYLSEVAEDQWMYDIAPYAEEGETYETFFAEFQASLTRPASGYQFVRPSAIYSIAELPGVFFVETGPDSATHFYDTGELLIPMGIPVRSSSHFDCYIT